MNSPGSKDFRRDCVHVWDNDIRTQSSLPSKNTSGVAGLVALDDASSGKQQNRVAKALDAVLQRKPHPVFWKRKNSYYLDSKCIFLFVAFVCKC